MGLEKVGTRKFQTKLTVAIEYVSRITTYRYQSLPRKDNHCASQSYNWYY